MKNKKYEYSEDSTSHCITCSDELTDYQRASLFDFCGGNFCKKNPIRKDNLSLNKQ